MDISLLKHPNTDPVINLPLSAATIRFCSTFNELAVPFEHGMPVDLVVIDRMYLAERFCRNGSIKDHFEKNNVPVIVLDDMVGSISPTFEQHRYPATTIGVISNEVIMNPEAAGQVFRAAVKSLSERPGASIQPAIFDILSKSDWALDPDYANQLGRFAPGMILK